MKKKKYKNIEIKELVPGMGGCIATDRIIVDGEKVNFMYRQKPDNDIDSGWNFFSGINEDDDYINNPDNLGVYDVNTIANYDPSIIPFLDSPVNSTFERDQETKEWKPV